MASLEQHWNEDEHIGDYPVEGEGHIKSWKHKQLEAEISVVKQHKGMKMYHRVYLVEPADEDSVDERKISKIGGDIESPKAAKVEAKEWMKRNPMAMKRNNIRCKECGGDAGYNNQETWVNCRECENSEVIEEGDQAERFELITKNGIQPYEVEA